MQFIFNHSAAHIRPLLLGIEQHIKKEVTACTDDIDQLLNRCKFIITELCTNAIKHSGETKSVLHVYKHNSELIIKRSDTGKPFSAIFNNNRISFPLTTTMNMLTLMEDDINRLAMQPLDNYSAMFYTEQKESSEDFTGQKINEHFGLIIICLSASRFVYTYNPDDGSNTYTVSIRLT
ncbi:MAG TPA: hypothetical protein VHB48_12215 [Chitinophagaceae bacterium]|nr:hypothetical protein [Chitinophagaceae bacterium]